MADLEEEQQLTRSPSHDSLFGSVSDESSNLERSDVSTPQSSLETTLIDTCDHKDDEETLDDASLIPPSWLTDDPTCGLTWAKDGVSLYPKWAFEPTIESIVATLKSALGCAQEYIVRFLHEGTLSKLYDVRLDDRSFIMRVSLPVYPRLKTEAEVATLNWVDQYIPLPVPRVKAYDSSQDNPLGFEWILMTKLEGRPLSECWEAVTLGSKERLVKQIAAFSASAFHQLFSGGIGSIYEGPCNADGYSYVVGEVVSMASFWGKYAGDTHRRLGPFSDAAGWARSRLQSALSSLQMRLDDAADADERETLQRMADLTRRIESLMSAFYPDINDPLTHGSRERESISESAEAMPLRTMLHHDNLSLDNILVNDDGIFTGVLDWQCITCLPLHESCEFPAFLQQAYDRFKEPIFKNYMLDDDGALHPAYFRDRRRYEITRLRRLYIEEMMHRAPGFVDIWRSERGFDLRDYEAAVQNCDNEFTVGIVESWVQAVESGREPAKVRKRLHELLAA
ncbi:phosphotransferase enzyme family-domain-containing protein [Xylaria venustula]|nr:phosphotransferase enzyme family-domain-containing protein [Xylaria venustula]